MGWFVFLIACVLALVIWGVINAHRQSKARTAALAALAKQWGLDFEAAKQWGAEQRFPGHAFFKQGDRRWVSNSMSGACEFAARPVTLHLGDFTYETDDTDGKGHSSSTTHDCSYLVVNLGIKTPRLAIRPESFGDKVMGVFGFRDLEFESAEFNRKFHVHASDKKFAFDVCHARAQESLMRAPFKAIDLVDGVLLVPSDKVWTPAQFAAVRKFAAELLAGWPAFVWDKLAAPAP